MILDLETDAIKTSILEINLYPKKVLSSIFFSVFVVFTVFCQCSHVVLLCMKLAVNWWESVSPACSTQEENSREKLVRFMI